MAQAAPPASAAGRPATTWLAFRQRMPGVSSLRHSGMSFSADVQLMGGIFLHQGAWWRKIPPISCTSKASSLHRTFGEGCWTATTQKLAEVMQQSQPDARFSTKISRRVTA